ncbi:MAG: DUF2240 family protein [Candidatus Aenigmatarchaeota archaeon]|nr:DUF2240 family protein [Candidatus Aenigmarchaeota archaeon]
MLSVDEILNELEEKTGKSKKELLKMIKSKQDELSGLVSEEGAAHLVARDLGIDLLKSNERFYSIKDVKPEMKRINLKGKIISITPLRSFIKKDGTEGKVRNIIISDGTGEAKIPLWDKQAEIADQVSVGEVLEIKNVGSRESNFGNIDLVLYRTSSLKKINEDIPVQVKSTNEIKIKDAVEGYFQIKAMVVDVFNTNPLFYVCPKCRARVDKDISVCPQDGKIEPEINMIITAVIDDGTGTLRSVFFRDVAKDFADVSVDVIKNMSQEEALRLIKENVLGKEFIFKGKIQKNKIFENLELVVNQISNVDVLEESEKIVEELSKDG